MRITYFCGEIKKVYIRLLFVCQNNVLSRDCCCEILMLLKCLNIDSVN